MPNYKPSYTREKARADAAEDALSAAQAEAAGYRGALEKLNEIRDQCVRTQRASWSSLVYPLVAILNEAGIESTVTDQELDTLFPSRVVLAAQPAAPVLPPHESYATEIEITEVREGAVEE